MEEKDAIWCWPWLAGCGDARKQVCVNLSSTPHCDASAEVLDFSNHHPPTRRRATRDRGSVVGDGVIPALLFD